MLICYLIIDLQKYRVIFIPFATADTSSAESKGKMSTVVKDLGHKAAAEQTCPGRYVQSRVPAEC